MKPVQMTIQTIEENYLRVQIKDDPHTLYNLLRIIVLEEDGVVLAGYARDRTFEDSLMFQIRTDGSVEPKDVLLNAAQKIIEMAVEFKQHFEDEYL